MVALIVCGGLCFVFDYIWLFSTLCPSSVAIALIGVARYAVWYFLIILTGCLKMI